MPRKKNKYIDYLVYLAVRLFAMGVHMFPIRVNYVTASILGKVFYLIDRKHREIAIRHLKLSFPDWEEKRYKRVALASFRSIVFLGLEILFTTRLITPESWRKHIILTNQADNVRLLTERKNGIIYVVGHFGNWEIVGYALAILGFDGFAVARPLDNSYLNDYLLGIREKKGLTVLDKKGATERMDEIFSSHRYVSFVSDQDAGRKGMFVDFFGREASTTKAPALMAMQYEVPVVVAYGRRLSKSYNFEIGIERIIRPEDWADKDDPIRWITQEYTAALEQVIRRTPQQYLWMHRRWKHRPKGEQKPEDGIA